MRFYTVEKYYSSFRAKTLRHSIPLPKTDTVSKINKQKKTNIKKNISQVSVDGFAVSDVRLRKVSVV